MKEEKQKGEILKILEENARTSDKEIARIGSTSGRIYCRITLG